MGGCRLANPCCSRMLQGPFPLSCSSRELVKVSKKALLEIAYCTCTGTSIFILPVLCTGTRSFRRAASPCLALSRLVLPRWNLSDAVCSCACVCGWGRVKGWNRKLSQAQHRNVYTGTGQNSKGQKPLGEAGKAKSAPHQVLASSLTLRAALSRSRCVARGRFCRFPERPTGGNR